MAPRSDGAEDIRWLPPTLPWKQQGAYPIPIASPCGSYVPPLPRQSATSKKGPPTRHLRQHLRRLAVLAAPLLVIACSDGQVTSPEVEGLDAPQFTHIFGGRLYGTNGGARRGATTPAASILYTIDATTGAATAVGPTGFNGVGAIAFAADGTLYGIASSPFQLITIDVNTGVGTLVGPTVGAGTIRGFMDISFRNGDGALFGALLRTSGCTRLATIDVTTGTATDIGLIGTCFPGRGLAFSTTDVLHHSDQNSADFPGTLYTVNQTTAAPTAVATLSFSGFPPGCCFRLNAMDYEPDTGVLYASVNNGFRGSGPNFLATVDPTTGVVTNLGQSVNGLDAIAWQPIPIIPVDIDIKPGSDPNSINCNNENESIAVAILTTDDFDATSVDHTTVTFEGASETHVNKSTSVARRHEEDVDGDGDTDLVLHFRLGDTDLSCDSTEGTLVGENFDGRDIEGTDAVRMIDEGGGKP